MAANTSFRDPAVQRCPFAFYKQLRDGSPVYWDPEVKCLVVSRYQSVRAIMLDTETFSNIGIVEPSMPSAATARAAKIRESTYLSVPMLVTNDPPQHTRYRRISNSILTAQQMRAMGPLIETTVTLYLDKLLANGGGEFIGEYAVPLPVAVIAALLGLPSDMTHKCKEWSDALMEPLSGMLSEEREIECAHQFVERQRYFAAAVERIRREGGPPEHLITRVALARTEDGELFGMPEALSLIEQHMIAGNETTTHALGMGIMQMATHPDLVAQLRASPAKVDIFVEEILRLFGPAQGQFRLVTRDTKIDGVDIAAGSKIMLRLGAANRDDRVFAMADEVDLERLNPRSHLAFGYGIHNCQGAPLARMEMAATFRAFAERAATMQVDESAGGPVYAESILHLALAKLPLRVTPVS